jgi:hypothetical protein
VGPFRAGFTSETRSRFARSELTNREVDRETGKVQVVHLVVGADSGRSVNAVACRGQVEGAASSAAFRIACPTRPDD